MIVWKMCECIFIRIISRIVDEGMEDRVEEERNGFVRCKTHGVLHNEWLLWICK